MSGMLRNNTSAVAVRQGAGPETPMFESHTGTGPERTWISAAKRMESKRPLEYCGDAREAREGSSNSALSGSHDRVSVQPVTQGDVRATPCRRQTTQDRAHRVASRIGLTSLPKLCAVPRRPNSKWKMYRLEGGIGTS
jgi:hypothetical protein